MRRASGLVATSNGAELKSLYKRDPVLSRVGVACLTPQHIMSVIERRAY